MIIPILYVETMVKKLTNFPHSSLILNETYIGFIRLAGDLFEIVKYANSSYDQQLVTTTTATSSLSSITTTTSITGATSTVVCSVSMGLRALLIAMIVVLVVLLALVIWQAIMVRGLKECIQQRMVPDEEYILYDRRVEREKPAWFLYHFFFSFFLL